METWENRLKSFLIDKMYSFVKGNWDNTYEERIKPYLEYDHLTYFSGGNCVFYKDNGDWKYLQKKNSHRFYHSSKKYYDKNKNVDSKITCIEDMKNISYISNDVDFNKNKSYTIHKNSDTIDTTNTKSKIDYKKLYKYFPIGSEFNISYFYSYEDVLKDMKGTCVVTKVSGKKKFNYDFKIIWETQEFSNSNFSQILNNKEEIIKKVTLTNYSYHNENPRFIIRKYNYWVEPTQKTLKMMKLYDNI